MQGYHQHYITSTTGDPQKPQEAYTSKYLLLPPGWDAGPMQGYPHNYITSTTGDPQKPQKAYTSKYLLLPLDGMLVQCRVTPTIILRVPQETHRSHRRPTPQGIYFSPGWDASPMQGYPHLYITSTTGDPQKPQKAYTSKYSLLPLDGMLVYRMVTPNIT